MNIRRGLKIAATTLGGAVALVTVIGFCLPTEVVVQRSIMVDGTPEDVFPHIADFQDGWREWNAFQKEDPAMQLTYSGPKEGVGARQDWDTNKMGEGHMEITKADPSKGVEFDLSLMHDSFRIHGSLLCEPAGRQTKVTWTDDMAYGPDPYTRYMGLLVKKPIGESFETSLATLKRKVEARVSAQVPTSL
jgi:hypothetical protein